MFILFFFTADSCFQSSKPFVRPLGVLSYLPRLSIHRPHGLVSYFFLSYRSQLTMPLPHSSALAGHTWDSCYFILNEVWDRPHGSVCYFFFLWYRPKTNHAPPSQLCLGWIYMGQFLLFSTKCETDHTDGWVIFFLWHRSQTNRVPPSQLWQLSPALSLGRGLWKRCSRFNMSAFLFGIISFLV